MLKKPRRTYEETVLYKIFSRKDCKSLNKASNYLINKFNIVTVKDNIDIMISIDRMSGVFRMAKTLLLSNIKRIFGRKFCGVTKKQILDEIKIKTIIEKSQLSEEDRIKFYRVR